jgi:hypothetical protein
MRARYAGSADAAMTLHQATTSRVTQTLTAPAPRIAARDTSFTTRRDNHTRTRSLRSGVGISPVTSAD